MNRKEIAKCLNVSERKVAAMLRGGSIRVNRDGSLNKRSAHWIFMLREWSRRYGKLAKGVQP